MRFHLLLLVLVLGCMGPPSEDELILFECNQYKTQLLKDDCLKNAAPKLVGNYTERALETCGSIEITLFKDDCYKQVAGALAVSDYDLAMNVCSKIGYENHTIECEKGVDEIASIS